MLRSFLDYADRYYITGWAQDDAQPDAPLSLLILDNDKLVARVLANRYRADLEAAGIGNGRHAFEFDFQDPLPADERHIIRVCREADGADIERSPILLGPRQPSDMAAQQQLASMSHRDLSDEQLVRNIDIMVDHVDIAVQQLVERSSGRGERAHYRHVLERWRRRAYEDRVPAAPLRRALVIDDRMPKPDHDAGSVAILSHIQSLQRLGFEVTFIAALEFATFDAYSDALPALGVMLPYAPYYGSIEEVMRRNAGEFDLVYLHRIANAAKYGELARHYFPEAWQIYSVADLHHVRVARQGAVEHRPELVSVARRLRLQEFAAAALADAVITHSSAEAAMLQAHVGRAKVHTVPWSATPRPTAVPFDRRHGIAFIGGYGHPPNLDAARWLIAEIMPLVRRRNPTIECLLVGSGLPDALLQRCADGVVAVGQVADLADIFDRVRLTVAPLRFGAGIKGKVIDSLAAGIPCVCTPIALEGVDLPAAFDVNGGATCESLVIAIQRVHDDAQVNEECREVGLRYIKEAFSQRNLDARMHQVIGPRADRKKLLNRMNLM